MISHDFMTPLIKIRFRTIYDRYQEVGLTGKSLALNLLAAIRGRS